jgi:DNA invertase Pin-like site-specific DNA recombinase
LISSFSFTLRDSEVDFVCADMPVANTLTIDIFYGVAQHERDLISSQTKAGLKQKILQAFTLGKPENLTERARQNGLLLRKQIGASHKTNAKLWVWLSWIGKNE